MSAAKRANKSRVFTQDKNTNVNKENNTVNPQSFKATQVRVASDDWDACNTARMLCKLLDNTEGNRAMKLRQTREKNTKQQKIM